MPKGKLTDKDQRLKPKKLNKLKNGEQIIKNTQLKLAKNGDKKSRNQFNNACRLLGLFDLSKKEWNEFKKNNTEIDEDFILKKINERTKAKNIGNFVLADTIRNELFKKGVVIEDQKGKTNWKYK